VSPGVRTFAVTGLDAGDVPIGRGCKTETLQPGGQHSVAITVIEIPPAAVPGDTCADPVELPAGAATAGSTADAVDDFTASCGGAGGPDVVYTLVVPTDSHATIAASARARPWS